MRSILFLAISGVLTGCSVISTVQHAWDWDPASRPGDVTAAAPVRGDASAARLVQLREQRQEIRARIAAEPDIRQRQFLYAQLHDIGRQLSPLERQLISPNLTH